MKLAVTKERRPGEARVAASPDSVKRLAALGFTVAVESGAGERAAMPDEAYAASGALIVSDPAALLFDADVVLKVQRPTTAAAGLDEVAAMKSGAVLVGMLAPYAEPDLCRAYADRGISAFALEFVPRITRAQTMDVLSSQANLAGYRAVLEAAHAYGRAFPMMMTAAGTVPAARVFVMGAGVAGLQAIATARRLGAVVTATDVRPAAKEQVESLGAKFVAVEDEEFRQAETAGGYAKEMSAAYREKQAALVAQHIAKQDIVITTALIPGRPAPKLVSAEMVGSMRPGSVIVDLAVEQGGNCAGSRPDEIALSDNGVRIVGWANMPSRIAVDASLLYARNLVAFLTPLVDKDSQALKIDTADEIVKASLLTKDGAVVHPAFAGQSS